MDTVEYGKTNIVSGQRRRHALTSDSKAAADVNKLLFEDDEVRRDLTGHESVTRGVVAMYGAPGFATTSLSFLIAVYANDFYGKRSLIGRNGLTLD